MRTALLRNNTRVSQSFGHFTLPPYGIGRVPVEVIEGFRRHPSRDFTVVADDPDSQLFFQTERRPSNPRYAGRQARSEGMTR